ncbi:MAG: hypothetical protein JO022_18340, partial [Acidobacteriaceae bacterium]|nr:hypothetical protein [Acidobacteriaceae bacterium]
SDAAIVNWVNDTFSAIMPDQEDIDRGAVSYTPSIASRHTPGGIVPQVHAFVGEARALETSRMVQLIQEAKGSVAVLVRARSHLSHLVPALRKHKIPFQAIELDALQDRAIIQQLLALTFALLHLADRVSWLAVLRAPWCGLTLSDLTKLAGQHHKTPIWDLLHDPALSLSADAQLRLNRCLPVLERALDQRGRVLVRRLVEETWLRLGGPACVDSDSELADAAAFFDLLESIEEAGDLSDFQFLRDQVQELFAQPDSKTDGRLQIMTIHKAKGLEFDNVILPGLDQSPRRDDDDLLVWLEMEGRLLLAPKGATGAEDDPIYKYLTHLERDKTAQEGARLLYVAATRARERLHLLGCASWNEAKQEITAAKHTFLHLLWPKVQHAFATAPRIEAAATESQTRERPIRRLPAGWTIPAPPPALEWTREAVPTEATPTVTYEWVGETLRHTGTVVHAYLGRIASDGLSSWTEERVSKSLPAMEAMLKSLGVPPLELATARSSVEKAVRQTLQSKMGRWILSAHQSAASEYAITGLVDGKPHSRVMDRTFIDDRGVRWIVDIKTSTHEGGDLQTFLDHEQSRYREQLEFYARLFAHTEERPVRLALYFPLLDTWREWPAPAVERRQASLFD